MKKISAKKTGVYFIALAAVLGLIAVGLTYMFISRSTREVPMLIANEIIVAGDPLDIEKFRVVQVPIKGRPQDAVLPDEDLNGFVALKDMNVKDILRRDNIVKFDQKDLPILSTRLRAVTDTLGEGKPLTDESVQLRGAEIPVESIAGMITNMKEGDKVAVTSVFVEDVVIDNRTEKIRRTETIFDYIHVLQIKAPDENTKGNVVLALTQRQFEALALAREKGKFYISLMPFGAEKPDNHPDILSELYVSLLDNPFENPLTAQEAKIAEEELRRNNTEVQN